MGGEHRPASGQSPGTRDRRESAQRAKRRGQQRSDGGRAARATRPRAARHCSPFALGGAKTDRQADRQATRPRSDEATQAPREEKKILASSALAGARRTGPHPAQGLYLPLVARITFFLSFFHPPKVYRRHKSLFSFTSSHTHSLKMGKEKTHVSILAIIGSIHSAAAGCYRGCHSRRLLLRPSRRRTIAEMAQRHRCNWKDTHSDSHLFFHSSLTCTG